MKYVILGGVAAGTKAAAKLKRCDRNADVRVYTKGADISYALVCAKGKRGYFLQNSLKAYGYTGTKVLESGAFFNEVKVPRNGRKLSAEEIKRVKGLGCLQDKPRYSPGRSICQAHR